MSTIIYERTADGVKYTPFRDYVLSEAIKPKRIEYGINKDFDDRKIDHTIGVSTGFIVNDNRYLVNITDDGEVSFGSFTSYDTDKPFIDNIVDYLSAKRTDNRTPTKIFSNVFYLILVLLKESKHKIIYFSGEDNLLDKFYDILIKNKNFIDELNKAGYRYLRSEKDKHYFSNK